MMHLGQTKDGELIVASNQALPSDILRIEYYREQKLFTLVYEDRSIDDELMPYEMLDEVSDIIKSSPNVIIVVMAQEGEEAYEYKVPLVQVGT